MNAKRFFYTLIALHFLLVIAIGGAVYLGDKLLAKQSQKIAQAKAEDELIEQKKRVKKQLEKKITEIGELKTLAEKFLPDTKNQEELVAEFYSISKQYGIDISGLTFNDSGASISSTSQTAPLKDAKGVLVFPFKTSNFTTNFSTLLTFMQALENNRRKIQITNIDLQPTINGQIIVGSMSMESYIRGTAPAPATTK
jgi:hypothetical protein